MADRILSERNAIGMCHHTDKCIVLGRGARGTDETEIKQLAEQVPMRTDTHTHGSSHESPTTGLSPSLQSPQSSSVCLCLQKIALVCSTPGMCLEVKE